MRAKEKGKAFFMAEYLYTKVTKSAPLLIAIIRDHFKSVLLVLPAKGQINSIHQKIFVLFSLRVFCKSLVLIITLPKVETIFLWLLYILGAK